MKGIIQITGEHDTGKTLAALGLYHPKETAFFHDDIKLPPIPLQEFAFCANLIDGTVFSSDYAWEPQQITFSKLREFVLNQIEAIPKSVKCIIFDTFTRFEASCQDWGKRHATLTREEVTMAPGKIFLAGQKWAEARHYTSIVLNNLNNRFETIILITHLKDHYEADKKTGKEIPASTKVLDRVCNMRFWLRQNPESGVPVILVLKRPSLTKITTTGLQVINAYPRRIKPLLGETSIWECLKRYEDNPISNRVPKLDEQPSAFEMSILDGILTEDQKEIWRANLKLTPDQFARQDAIDKRIRTLGEEKYNTFEIIDAIEEEFEGEIITAEMVAKLL